MKMSVVSGDGEHVLHVGDYPDLGSALLGYHETCGLKMPRIAMRPGFYKRDADFIVCLHGYEKVEVGPTWTQLGVNFNGYEFVVCRGGE